MQVTSRNMKEAFCYLETLNCTKHIEHLLCKTILLGSIGIGNPACPKRKNFNSIRTALWTPQTVLYKAPCTKGIVQNTTCHQQHCVCTFLLPFCFLFPVKQCMFHAHVFPVVIFILSVRCHLSISMLNLTAIRGMKRD